MRKTAEFSYEILAAALIIIFTVLLCAEYLWLYVLSKKNEETDIQKREINSRIHAMTEAFLYSPTASSRETELTSLIEYIGDDPLKRDEASVQFIQLMKRSEDIPPEKSAKPDNDRKIPKMKNTGRLHKKHVIFCSIFPMTER